MTRREVFTKAMSMDVFSDEEKDVFRKAIESLDKRSSKPTKTQLENEGVKVRIKEVLSSTPMTAKEIAEAVEVSTNKVAALLKQIEGVIVTEGKGKNPKTYAIAE